MEKTRWGAIFCEWTGPFPAKILLYCDRKSEIGEGKETGVAEDYSVFFRNWE